MADGSVVIDTELDTGGLEEGVRRARNEMQSSFSGISRDSSTTADNIEKPWKKAFTGIGNIAKTGIKAAATAITGLGAGMIAFGADAMKTGANFEAQMSKVKAISGATGDDFQMLVDKAREMGRATKFSATESGEALEYMAVA